MRFILWPLRVVFSALLLQPAGLFASTNFICGPSLLTLNLTIRQADNAEAMGPTTSLDRRRKVYRTTETRWRNILTARYGTAEYLEDLWGAKVLPGTSASGWALYAIPHGTSYKVEARKKDMPNVPLDSYLNIRSTLAVTAYSSTKQMIFSKGNNTANADEAAGSGTFTRETMTEVLFGPLADEDGPLVPTLELIGPMVSKGVEHRWYPEGPANKTNQAKVQILKTATASIFAPYFDPDPANDFFATGSASLGPASPVAAP
jgi:hypothetical protein